MQCLQIKLNWCHWAYWIEWCFLYPGYYMFTIFGRIACLSVQPHGHISSNNFGMTEAITIKLHEHGVYGNVFCICDFVTLGQNLNVLTVSPLNWTASVYCLRGLWDALSGIYLVFDIFKDNFWSLNQFWAQSRDCGTSSALLPRAARAVSSAYKTFA